MFRLKNIYIQALYFIAIESKLQKPVKYIR